jgi:hypothetical protein
MPKPWEDRTFRRATAAPGVAVVIVVAVALTPGI